MPTEVADERIAHEATPLADMISVDGSDGQSAVSDPRLSKPRVVCGARCRNGEPCQMLPIAGRTRCRMHGGKTLRGSDSPRFKHGLYSKVLPKELKAKFNQLLSDPDLLDSRAEISMLQIRLTQLAARIGTRESGESWREMKSLLEQLRQADEMDDQERRAEIMGKMEELTTSDVGDERSWVELTDMIERSTRVVEREWKRVLTTRQVATAEQVRALIVSIAETVLSNVSNPYERQKIAEHVGRLGFVQPVSAGHPINSAEPEESD